MKLGIIGAGNMGKALGKLAAKAGYEVLYAAQTEASAKAAAESTAHGARFGSVREAVAFGDLVLLAVPFGAVEAVLGDVTTSLAGKILIDLTNPLAPDFMSLTLGFETSAGEEIAKLAPGARVVKAFNTVFAQVLNDGPRISGEKVTVFFAGDDAAAKGTVERFIQELGFDAVHAGPLRNARYLEPATELLIQLAYGQGMGTELSLQALRPRTVAAGV